MTETRQARVARGNIDRYNQSTDYTLNDVYGKASHAKHNAYRYCENLMKKLNGYGLKILSYNTFMFTAAFLFDDPENGNVKMMYITPNYDIAIDF